MTSYFYQKLLFFACQKEKKTLLAHTLSESPPKLRRSTAASLNLFITIWSNYALLHFQDFFAPFLITAENVHSFECSRMMKSIHSEYFVKRIKCRPALDLQHDLTGACRGSLFVPQPHVRACLSTQHRKVKSPHSTHITYLLLPTGSKPSLKTRIVCLRYTSAFI